MNSLIESWEPFQYTQEESADVAEGTKKVVLKGVIQRADTLNQNGRVYPRQLLEREIRNYQKFIREKRSVGELDHPEESVVSLQKASHIIREARMEGNDVFGVIELLNTPMGKIAQQLVADGVMLGISSRGVGSVKKEGDRQVVQDDFQLICWDIVSEPSTPGAFIREGRNRAVSVDRVFNRGDRIFRAANDILALSRT